MFGFGKKTYTETEVELLLLKNTIDVATKMMKLYLDNKTKKPEESKDKD